MQAGVFFLILFIKLLILISVYASLTLIVFRIIGSFKPSSFINKISKRKGRFWFSSAGIFAITLIIIHNTHWGNYGSTNILRIPLKHGMEIKQIDGSNTIISNQQFAPMTIGNFVIRDDYVFTFTPYCTTDTPGNYIIWNLETNNVQLIKSRSEYLSKSAKYNLPKISEYPTFFENYSSYWFKWRYWVML